MTLYWFVSVIIVYVSCRGCILCMQAPMYGVNPAFTDLDKRIIVTEAEYDSRDAGRSSCNAWVHLGLPGEIFVR